MSSCEYCKIFKNSFFHSTAAMAESAFTTTFRNYCWESLVIILFTLTHLSKQPNTCCKAGVMLHKKNTWKFLDMLQIVNRETQPLLLLLTDFLSCFRVSVVDLSICLLGKIFQGFEEQQQLFYTFPSKQIHARIQQWKP